MRLTRLCWCQVTSIYTISASGEPARHCIGKAQPMLHVQTADGQMTSTVIGLDKRAKRTNMIGLPSPEIQLRGPPVISTTTELQGQISLELCPENIKYLSEIYVKLEASAITWSSGGHTTNRQKKRLYIERQTLWRNPEDTKSSNSPSLLDFIFAMPPGYLPPSFRFNKRIYIQYRIRAVATFKQGKCRTTCNLIHEPSRVVPEEKWGLAASQNWIIIHPGIKHHPQTRTQTASYSKLGPPVSVKNNQAQKLSLRDKLRGRKFYPVHLEGMYLESGVMANTQMDSIKVQLVRKELPLVELKVHRVTVALTAITEVSVNKRKFVDTNNIILVNKIFNKVLDGDVAVDITEFLGPINLPSVDPTFHTKTLSRSYKLVICCEVVASNIKSEVYITLPMTIFGNPENGLLPVYERDVKLPAYSECVSSTAVA